MRPRPHPFACEKGLLCDVLERLGLMSLPGDAVERKLALMLPSSELGPQASPQLLRVVAEHERPERPSRLEAWEVNALGFDAGRALDLLLAVRAVASASTPGARAGSGGGVAVGDSVRFLAEAFKLALELVARGRLRPVLVRRGEQWVARWVPVIDDGGDAARVALLARCMPPLLRAEPSCSLDGRVPDAVLGDLLSAVVDACARELLADHIAGLDKSLPGGAVRAWLRRSSPAIPLSTTTRGSSPRSPSSSTSGGRRASAYTRAAHVPDVLPAGAAGRGRGRGSRPRAAGAAGRNRTSAVGPRRR